MDRDKTGWIAALLSPIFLGIAPIFGKIALINGADPFTVASVRMALAVSFLWIIYGIFWRKFIYIYPAGLIACAATGATNGIGSLFYYSGLQRLDASVAQLLNASYLIFVILLTRISGAQIGFRTISRVGIALVGIFLITGGLGGGATWLGVGLMMGNALLFAGTVVMSQRILYEMPAQTVTLYVMTSMATVVLIARLIYGISWTPLNTDASTAIVALAITTAISRLLLFAGVKGIGGVRTVLLTIAESGVGVALAFIVFDERLALIQWIGVAALMSSLFIPTEEIKGGYKGMPLPNIAGLRFRQIAFTKAFLQDQDDEILTTQEIRGMGNVFGVDERISTDEMEALRKILGDEGFNRLPRG